MASNAAPNPVRLVQDHLAAHITDLEADLAKAITKVRAIQEELTTARTLLAVAPQQTEER